MHINRIIAPMTLAAMIAAVSESFLPVTAAMEMEINIIIQLSNYHFYQLSFLPLRAKHYNRYSCLKNVDCSNDAT